TLSCPLSGTDTPFGVRCFARFYLSLGQCDEELGEVDEEDCCQNPQYGYQTTDGVCRSCGSPVWSPWSPWSQCNVPCGEGVMQRNRKCFGIEASECEKPKEKVEMIPCNGTCCQSPCPVDGGWGSWSPFSSCPVTCGVGLQESFKRCDNPAPKHGGWPCPGEGRRTRICLTNTHCPGTNQGTWGEWDSWTLCSPPCGDGSRRFRRRLCNLDYSDYR
uniref:Complement factor properdin n=1 Tax=Gasterosteus aculeatus aculeatus TaxID=481459 RepID=G3PPI0_GASAC